RRLRGDRQPRERRQRRRRAAARVRRRPGAGAPRGRTRRPPRQRALRRGHGRRAGRAADRWRSRRRPEAGGERAVSGERPLRVLFVSEGVLGHRTLIAQLEAALGRNPRVEAQFATVPEPGRLARLLLRRWRRIGDADLYELRWRLRWSWQARRLLRR